MVVINNSYNIVKLIIYIIIYIIMDYNKPDALDRADNMLLKCGSFASIIQIICSVICILCFSL